LTNLSIVFLVNHTLSRSLWWTLWLPNFEAVNPARWLAGLMLMAGSMSGVFAEERLVEIKTETAGFGLGDHGSLLSILRSSDRRDYLATGQPAPLLSVRVGGKLFAPDRAVWDPARKVLDLYYPTNGIKVAVAVTAKTTHVDFEVLSAQPKEAVELVLWGPYPTSIRDIIGETVGVVRDGEFAVGIQTLNVKTLGGYPNTEDDAEGEWGEDDLGKYPDLDPELLKGQGYRTDTARRTPFGSVIQAYCRNRDRTRIVSTWGQDKYEAPAFADGGVVGSKIALFGGPASKALETIADIEITEGLPHPLIDGVWGKVFPEASASYLIVDFGEESIDRAIEMTRKAGLKYLYHSSPFSTWGHFRLKPQLFPNGWEGLRMCARKAKDAGIRLGVHMLSNHLTTNDAYVTPRADARLATIGRSKLSGALNAGDQDIEIESPEFFRTKTSLNAVRIDHEIVRFETISDAPPWRLRNCERGAFGTVVAKHDRGTVVARLMDSDRYLLTDVALAQEVAKTFAGLCTYADLRQTSFDGLEGNRSTGYGQYGAALFTKTWYDALSPDLRGEVINDASRPGHFNWHVYTRMNWGEPWYAGFRESQTLYRFKNQAYFERNLMPRMLGWFALRPNTSLADAEWLLARAAGYNAGFALASSLASTAQLTADPSSADSMQKYGSTPVILQAIREWERARLLGAFPEKVRAALRDNNREFHLKTRTEWEWDLREVHVQRNGPVPAESRSIEMSFTNLDAIQPLQWTVQSTAKVPMTELTVSIDGVVVTTLTGNELPPEGSVEYNGGDAAMLLDASRREIGRTGIGMEQARISPGTHRVSINGGQPIKAELRTHGGAVRIVAPGRPRL